MRWTAAAEQALTNFLAQAPAEAREEVRATARRAAHTQALQMANYVVDVDEVVVGFIQATPPALRPALRPVLAAAGINVNRYAKQLTR